MKTNRSKAKILCPTADELAKALRDALENPAQSIYNSKRTAAIKVLHDYEDFRKAGVKA